MRLARRTSVGGALLLLLAACTRPRGEQPIETVLDERLRERLSGLAADEVRSTVLLFDPGNPDDDFTAGPVMLAELDGSPPAEAVVHVDHYVVEMGSEEYVAAYGLADPRAPRFLGLRAVEGVSSDEGGYLEVMDLDRDGLDEILFVGGSSEETPHSTFSLLAWRGGRLVDLVWDFDQYFDAPEYFPVDLDGDGVAEIVGLTVPDRDPTRAAPVVLARDERRFWRVTKSPLSDGALLSRVWKAVASGDLVRRTSQATLLEQALARAGVQPSCGELRAPMEARLLATGDLTSLPWLDCPGRDTRIPALRRALEADRLPADTLEPAAAELLRLDPVASRELALDAFRRVIERSKDSWLSDFLSAATALYRSGDRGGVVLAAREVSSPSISPAVRAHLVAVLAIDREAMLPVLLRLASGPYDVETRLAAGLQLAKADVKRARVDRLALEPLLESDESAMRAHAATALGHLGDRAAIPALERALAESDECGSRSAREALAELRGDPAEGADPKAAEPTCCAVEADTRLQGLRIRAATDSELVDAIRSEGDLETRRALVEEAARRRLPDAAEAAVARSMGWMSDGYWLDEDERARSAALLRLLDPAAVDRALEAHLTRETPSGQRASALKVLVSLRGRDAWSRVEGTLAFDETAPGLLVSLDPERAAPIITANFETASSATQATDLLEALRQTSTDPPSADSIARAVEHLESIYRRPDGAPRESLELLSLQNLCDALLARNDPRGRATLLRWIGLEFPEPLRAHAIGALGTMWDGTDPELARVFRVARTDDARLVRAAARDVLQRRSDRELGPTPSDPL